MGGNKNQRQAEESPSDKLLETFIEYVRKDFDEMKKSITFMTDENKDLRKKVTDLEKRQRLSEGLINRLQQQINQQEDTITDLKCRSMRDNLLFNGIQEDENETWEKTKEKVYNFMTNELKMTTPANIDRAHRLGKPGTNPRPIVAKMMSSSDKDAIFKYVKNLKGKKHLSVSEQFPAEVQERRKQLWPLYKQAKENKTNNVKWNVDKLIINGKTHTAKGDNLSIDPETDLEDVNIAHTTIRKVEGSTFIGHAALIDNVDDVNKVIANLLQDKALTTANHTFYAYRVGRAANIKEGHRDDREHGAGSTLKRWLQDSGKTNIIVIGSRWFGGTHMGPRRFDVFKELAEDACKALDEL